MSARPAAADGATRYTAPPPAAAPLSSAMQRFLCLADFEAPARRRLPRCVFEYIEGGAEEGVSVRANRAAFDDWHWQPRVLRNTAQRDCSVTTLGEEWAAPFGIAPMGAMGLAALQADLVLARAAAQARIPFVLSGSSLVAMERVIGENPRAWFQAYLSVDAAENQRLIARVRQSGFSTLVITVDVPVGGNRERDVRNGYTSPLRPTPRLLLDGALHPRWFAGTLLRSLAREGMPYFENYPLARVPMISLRATRPHRRDNLDWDDLRRLRDQWPGRLVLKGVLAPEDLQAARAAGVDAVVVSNHGGRQLDGAMPPLRALPALHAEANGMELLLDSGVRRGTDVLKALALGARHVFLGRPFLYAAVVGGQEGVARAIALLRGELLRDLALLGCETPDPQRLRAALSKAEAR